MSRMFPFIALLGIVGCGGSCPNAGSASSETAARPPAESAPAVVGSEEPSSVAESPADSPPAVNEPKPVTPDVQFPEGASVAQAMAAVPRGVERANIDAETLAEPLQNETTWEPCKVGAQHFKLKVAVWNGHAVGVDVTTPSKPLAACVEKQVRNLTWPSKVKSLNSVEYSM